MSHDLLRAFFPQGLCVVCQPLVLTFLSCGALGDEGFASAVRDGIGRGLKRMCGCSAAADCPCAYCCFFKPRSPAGMAGSVGPAFVLEASNPPSDIRAGDLVRMNLVLLGQAVEALPWFLVGILHCGQRGIGSPRARFTVDAAGESQDLRLSEIFKAAGELAGAGGCTVRFVSPCILEDGGKRRDSADFQRIVKAIVERLQPNVGYWCGVPLRNRARDALAAPLIEQAGAVESRFILDAVVHELAKGFRGKKDSLSGFTGTLEVRGNLDPFGALLIAGSLVHVGLRPHLDRGRYLLCPVVDGKEIDFPLAQDGSSLPGGQRA